MQHITSYGLPEAPTESAPDRMLEPLLTAEEVAAILKVRKGRVYELVRSGSLPAVHLGRQVRFRRADLEAWLDRGGEKAS